MSCCLLPSSASNCRQYCRRSSGSVGTASGIAFIAFSMRDPATRFPRAHPQDTLYRVALKRAPTR